MLPSRFRVAALCCAALAVTIFLQWHGGAYRAEWTGAPDEPVHYLTGLSVHDYLVHGFPGSFPQWMQGYQARYPAVQFGTRPSLFYAVQALWTLPFTSSRASLLLMMAVISAAVLARIATVALGYFPFWKALGVMVVIACVTGFESASRTVGPEMLLALFLLLSLATLASHLNKPSRSTAVGFGLLSVCAILTEPTGIVMAPLPLLAVALLRRWRLLQTWLFWVPALLLALACVPWFWLSSELLFPGGVFLGGLRFRWERVPETLNYWIRALGPIGAPLVVLGLGREVWRILTGRENDGLRLSLFLLLPAVLVLRAFIGSWETGHLVSTLPVMLPFVCAGLGIVIEHVIRNRKAGVVIAILMLSTSAVRHARNMPPKPRLGFGVVARDIARNPKLAMAPLVIISDSEGAAVFTAEVASTGHWAGPVIETTASELTARPVVVLDAPEAAPSRVALFAQMVSQEHDQWEVVASYPRWYADPSHPPGTIQLLRSLTVAAQYRVRAAQ